MREDRHPGADDRHRDQPGDGVLRDLPRPDADVSQGRRGARLSLQAHDQRSGARMRRTRGLWISIARGPGLVGASVLGFATGTRPVARPRPRGRRLGDPVGARRDARGRDGPGAGEHPGPDRRVRRPRSPILFVTGDTIEVQIPGLARGTIQERPKASPACSIRGRTTFGCFADRVGGDRGARGGGRQPGRPVGLPHGRRSRGDPPCFGTEKDAQTRRSTRSRSPRPTERRHGADRCHGATGPRRRRSPRPVRER